MTNESHQKTKKTNSVLIKKNSMVSDCLIKMIYIDGKWKKSSKKFFFFKFKKKSVLIKKKILWFLIAL